MHEAADLGPAGACWALGGCGIGQAKATLGLELKARQVIRRVVPIGNCFATGAIDAANREALACCSRASAGLADRPRCNSIALPALGAWAFGWPPDEVASVAAATTAGLRFQRLHEIRFVTVRRRTLLASGGPFGVAARVGSGSNAVRYPLGFSAT